MWKTGNPAQDDGCSSTRRSVYHNEASTVHICFFFGTIQKKATVIEIDLTKHTIYVYACGLTCPTFSRSSYKMQDLIRADVNIIHKIVERNGSVSWRSRGASPPPTLLNSNLSTCYCGFMQHSELCICLFH